MLGPPLDVGALDKNTQQMRAVAGAMPSTSQRRSYGKNELQRIYGELD